MNSDVVNEFKPQVYSETMTELKHLIPLFKVYLWLNGLSVLIFVLELIVARSS